MATWAIGDVHGCFRTLRELVGRPEIAGADRLWFVGDLVNRGPRSLEVLRYVADLGERATVVLGNHDLHFLAVALGAAKPRKKDTFEEILGASDRDQLVAWLLERPLLSREGKRVLVHAGLLAGWSCAQSEKRARCAERALRHAQTAIPYLEAFRPNLAPGSGPEALDPEIVETIRVMSLLRTVDSNGDPLFGYTGTVDERPEGSVPWFDVEERETRGLEIVFGHWAALGLMVRPDAVALDTGCAWGGALSAVRLEDRRVEQVENRG